MSYLAEMIKATIKFKLTDETWHLNSWKIIDYKMSGLFTEGSGIDQTMKGSGMGLKIMIRIDLREYKRAFQTNNISIL